MFGQWTKAIKLKEEIQNDGWEMLKHSLELWKSVGSLQLWIAVRVCSLVPPAWSTSWGVSGQLLPISRPGTCMVAHCYYFIVCVCVCVRVCVIVCVHERVNEHQEPCKALWIKVPHKCSHLPFSFAHTESIPAAPAKILTICQSSNLRKFSTKLPVSLWSSLSDKACILK